MSELAQAAGSSRRRRADAERSIAAILDAAMSVLADQPDASMAEIASAAGVARQTVYAHFASREVLLVAVTERALSRSLAAFDEAEPQTGAAAEALGRLTTAWWSEIERHARVLGALAAAYPSAEEIHRLHAPILERLEQLARRGQRSGEFDRRLEAGWLASAFLALMHATAEEVAAGRIEPGDGGRALERTIPRLFAG